MLAHALYQQRLPQAVVDLVSAGVQQILALQINLRAAQFLREPTRKKQWRRAPRIVLQQSIQARTKAGIAFGFFILALQFFERSDQRLGNVAAAVSAEAPRDTRRSFLIAFPNRKVPNPSALFAQVGSFDLRSRKSIFVN